MTDVEEDRSVVSVLLVDDRRDNLLALEAILAPLGHRLVIAESGEEALKRLLVEDFALILLDVMMPGMDGFETAARIKQRERSRDIPIIFLTALTDDIGNAMRGFSSGSRGLHQQAVRVLDAAREGEGLHRPVPQEPPAPAPAAAARTPSRRAAAGRGTPASAARRGGDGDQRGTVARGDAAAHQRARPRHHRLPTTRSRYTVLGDRPRTFGRAVDQVRLEARRWSGSCTSTGCWSSSHSSGARCA
jgi:CheY-like chemotaxis protein